MPSAEVPSIRVDPGHLPRHEGPEHGKAVFTAKDAKVHPLWERRPAAIRCRHRPEGGPPTLAGTGPGHATTLPISAPSAVSSSKRPSILCVLSAFAVKRDSLSRPNAEIERTPEKHQSTDKQRIEVTIPKTKAFGHRDPGLGHTELGRPDLPYPT